MRTRPRRHETSNLLVVLTASLLPHLISASTFDCSHIRIERQSFDLSKLSGPHSVSHLTPHPPSQLNTTYTLDICKPLRRTKGVPKSDECPNATRVCGIERTINEDGSQHITGVIPIAGDYVHHGRPLEAEWTRLKTSSSNADSEKEGLRLVMHGGQYPFNARDSRKKKAVIEFLCDRNRTGLEGLGESAGEEEKHAVAAAAAAAVSAAKERRDARDDGNDGDNDDGGDDDNDDDDDKDDDEPEPDDGDDDDGSSLRFIRDGPTSEDVDEDTLRLEWRTKYACEGSKDDDDEGSKSGHWGFFTWLIIILFLAIATYIIFGSWLNYNRYGARGWDLLPHGDTVRDIPYLLKDFTRRVLHTVQGSGAGAGGGGGGGSRGGYSAV